MQDHTGAPTATLLCLTESDRRPGLDAAVEALPTIAPPGSPRWVLRHLDSAGELVASAAEADAVLIDLADPSPVLARLTGRDLPLIVMARAGQDPRQLFDAGADEYLPEADFSPALLERTLRFCDRTRALQGHIDYLAQHDILTGLPNRRLYERQLQLALHAADRHGRCLAVASLQLDDFDARVRAEGQDAAERLLVDVAGRLSGCLRRSDLVARAHADEFLVMLECSQDLSDLAAAAEKMLAALQHPDDGQSVTASMGIAVHPEAGRTPESLLREARAARDEVRSSGGNDFRFYDAELEVVGRQRMLMEQALPGAIDRGEMSLSYQPRLDLARHRITGAEVLLRWNSPEFGQVGPDRFIPVAEAGGAIGRIGAWVLEGALEQARHWHDQGIEVRLGVNVSAGQFQGDEFDHRVSRALEHAGVPARLLELELTERVFVANVAGHRALFDHLNELGVGLAVDDFGVGYSALSYLRDFPVHALKIDRSFVDPLPESEDDAAIVRAVIALGHALGLRVVAEGVETRGQLEFLRTAGCDEAQGFLIGSGSDAAGFDALLASGLPELAPDPAATGR